MGGFSDIAAGLRPYPNAPGYKEPTTSKAAARAIARKADILREKVFAAIVTAGAQGLTPDEVAAILGEDEKAIRPRCSELRKAERIKRNGLRRVNESGLLAAVLVKA
jgi:DNA-directed RNA polymerase specialized sigma24 family protein